MLMIRLSVVTAICMLVAGCENFQSSQPANQASYRLVLPQESMPAAPAPQVVRVSQGQLMHTSRQAKVIDGTSAVDDANKKAVIKPSSTSTINSIIVFPYQAGSLYEIYATPMNITDVQMQAGEQVISIAAGDTVRWEISKTISGTDSNRVEHLLIKPLSEDLDTTLVITTNFRTYHILLKSTKNTFMATVQWQYDDQGMMVNGASTGAVSGSANPTGNGLSLNAANLNLGYKTKVTHGNSPDWLPKAVFNDGMKTYIEFPSHIESAPALFIKQSGSGDAAVNYRVVGNYYVIDQVITDAELTSGTGMYQTVVEIKSSQG